jgi:predicted transcriptional regulator
MPWKELDIDSFAKKLGINASEAREKQKIIQLIVKTRKELDISQAGLAEKIGVSQSRIAQIESGIGTSKISFDVLLNVLTQLGYDYKIVSKKAA